MAVNLVITDNNTIIQYTSVGETVFTYNFPIVENDEIKVSVNGVLQTIGSIYTVQGVGDAGGGTITFLVATTAGEIITLWQEMPIKRLTGFATGAAVLVGDALNTEFVRQVRQDQENRRDLGRSLRLAVDDTVAGTSMILPAAVARKSKFLRFSDASGAPEMAEILVAGTVLSESVIAAFLSPSTFKHFPTIATMVADAALELGDVCITEGYTAAGDGAWGMYRVVAPGTGTNDGALYHNLTGISGQAALLSFDATSLANLGAVVNIGQRFTHNDGIFVYEFEALAQFTPNATSILNDVNSAKWRVVSVDRLLSGKFTYPGTWTGPTPDVYWRDDGKWFYQYDDDALFRQNFINLETATKAKTGGKTYWVDGATGNDGNGGLVQSDALATLTAAQAKSDVLTIMLKGDGEFYETSRMANSINIIGWGDYRAPFIFKIPQAIVFTVHATATNVWTLDAGATILGAPMSARMFDQFGLPIEYQEVASVALVSDTPFSYYLETTSKMHVNASAQPVIGTDIFATFLNWGVELADSTADLDDIVLYLENLIFPAQTRLLTGSLSTTTGITLYAQNVHACGGQTLSPFTFGGVGGIGVTTILRNCIAAYGKADGFDYSEGQGIEINCRSYKLGRGGGSTQGSTSHEGALTLRIGGDYDSAGQNSILDVGDGQTINLGARAGAEGVANSFAVASTRDMWCFDCKPSGVATGDHYNNGGSGAMFVSGNLSGLKLGGTIKLFGET